MEEKPKQEFKIVLMGPIGSGKTAIYNQLRDPDQDFVKRNMPTKGVHSETVSSASKDKKLILCEVGGAQIPLSPGANATMEDANVFLITLDAETFKDKKQAAETLKTYKEWAQRFAFSDAQIQLVVTKTDLIAEDDKKQFEKNVSAVARQIGLDNNPILYSSAKNNNVDRIRTDLADVTLKKTDLLIGEIGKRKGDIQAALGKNYPLGTMVERYKALSDLLKNLVAEKNRLYGIMEEDRQRTFKPRLSVVPAVFEAKYPPLEKRHQQLSEGIEQLKALKENFTREIENCQTQCISDMGDQINVLRKKTKEMFYHASTEKAGELSSTLNAIDRLEESLNKCRTPTSMSIEERQEKINAFRETLAEEICRFNNPYSGLGKLMQQVLSWLDSKLGISKSYSIFSEASKLSHKADQAAEPTPKQGPTRPSAS